MEPAIEPERQCPKIELEGQRQRGGVKEPESQRQRVVSKSQSQSPK